MTGVRHLVIGPDRHGVVLHGVQVAEACGHRVSRQAESDPGRLDLTGVDVVHVPFTDRLFATTAEASATAFDRLADAVAASGAALSVTLHDLPYGDDELSSRRVRCYASVIARCHGVVVNSWHELARMQHWGAELRSLRVIELPIDPAGDARPAPAGTEVGVLGFVYPDRGYDRVLAELPAGSGLIAIGTPSDGHDDLPARYADQARRLGRDWHCTGYLEPEELRDRLTTVAVPVAPNQRVSASGSINSWLAHGRRPLVARSAYAEEFERAHPGLILLYDADRDGELRALIAERLRDPAMTVLPAALELRSNLDRVISGYAEHLRACRPLEAIEVRGRFVLPANRWDLLAGSTAPVPEVSVVVPYYRAQRQLDLVLAGLALQTHPGSRLQVIVADDGSPERPQVDAAGLCVQVIHQPDRGFRAAAVRNLGASIADGQVLLFLDGDTVPEPGYVERLVRLPALAHDLLVTGRRRHADLSSLTPAGLAAWFTGHALELPAPEWLNEGYRRSRNLLDVDSRAYRLVISAVLGLDRDLFDEIGGFDAGIEGYGGEDWELAWRAYQAGAVFAHVPEAVAWHDGPDWAGRDVAGRREQKNAETLMLAQRVPDPGLRDGGAWFGRPGVVITLPVADDVALLATARSAFAAVPDSGLWLVGEGAPSAASRLADPRIRAGEPPVEVLASCRVRVQLTQPADLSALVSLVAEAERLGEVVTPVGRLRTSRLVARHRRWPEVPEVFQRHDRTGLSPWPAELVLDRVLSDLRRKRG